MALKIFLQTLSVVVSVPMFMFLAVYSKDYVNQEKEISKPVSVTNNFSKNDQEKTQEILKLTKRR